MWITDKLKGLYVIFCQHHQQLCLEGENASVINSWDEFASRYIKAPAMWDKSDLLGQQFDYIMYGGWAKLSMDKDEDFDLAIERQCMEALGLRYKTTKGVHCYDGQQDSQ
jgi:hypothetical protein